MEQIAGWLSNLPGVRETNMTQDEQNAEKLRVIERYSALQSKIECLRTRIHGAYGYLSQIEMDITSAKDLSECMPKLDNVVKGMGDVKADLDGLSKAIYERRRLEESLRRMNLGSLIQRP